MTTLTALQAIADAEQEGAPLARFTATINVNTGRLRITDGTEDGATLPEDAGMVLNGATLAPWGEGEFDLDRADEALSDLGYLRATGWAESGDMQSSATVVHP